MQRTLWLAPAFAGFLFVVGVPPSRAQVMTPDELVRSVTQDTLSIIKQQHEAGTGNAKSVARLVEAKVVPHFDFTRMTRLAMGRDWRLASAEQQQAVSAQFKTLLVHTYSAELANYRDQKIEFIPSRALPEDAEVTVRSVVKQPGGEPVTIDYALAKEPDGWKVYNVTVDGVSLVITYRDEFASLVRNRGVDGLIQALAARNQKNDAAT